MTMKNMRILVGFASSQNGILGAFQRVVDEPEWKYPRGYRAKTNVVRLIGSPCISSNGAIAICIPDNYLEPHQVLLRELITSDPWYVFLPFLPLNRMNLKKFKNKYFFLKMSQIF